ncbi:MAG: hypothetical protein IT271_03245 [Chitinophagales bacterium]|nr:hypothetical protein [Chitinophagales bacterium]
MKKLLIILSFLFALSCKKECNNQNKQNVLHNKIKSLTYYESDSSNTISRYYFNYDTTTGLLISIDLHGRFQGIDTNFNSYINIERANNTVYFYNNFEGKQYLISTIGKQITSIIKIDTLSGSQELATVIFLKNDKTDSIFDIGIFLQTNISFYNFKYDVYNCNGYSSKWREFLGIYVNKADTVSFTFTNIVNNNMIPNQLPCTDHGGGSVLNDVVYYLGIDGYYIVKPNTFLIDSSNYSNNSYSKYFYTMNENIVNSTLILTNYNSNIVRSYQEYTYYQ